jgi:hypothetical protein
MGVAQQPRHLRRWELTGSLAGWLCNDVQMCCLELICASKRICKNPDIVGVREEWAEAIHATARGHTGHKQKGSSQTQQNSKIFGKPVICDVLGPVPGVGVVARRSHGLLNMGTLSRGLLAVSLGGHLRE